uniref:Uncharacterized protein n=1 Tax=Plectus sambesii TaxID=2011161 RepID=A0A914V2S1_9BILA
MFRFSHQRASTAVIAAIVSHHKAPIDKDSGRESSRYFFDLTCGLSILLQLPGSNSDILLNGALTSTTEPERLVACAAGAAEFDDDVRAAPRRSLSKDRRLPLPNGAYHQLSTAVRLARSLHRVGWRRRAAVPTSRAAPKRLLVAHV